MYAAPGGGVHCRWRGGPAGQITVINNQAGGAGGHHLAPEKPGVRTSCGQPRAGGAAGALIDVQLGKNGANSAPVMTPGSESIVR